MVLNSYLETPLTLEVTPSANVYDVAKVTNIVVKELYKYNDTTYNLTVNITAP
jgi:hypothetical protein